MVGVANQDRGIPYVGVLVARCSSFWTFVLSRTRFGRHVYAVGGNAEAARRAGINVDRIRIACFAICSMMAALGGIILASRLRSVDTNAGGGSILLYSIAAAVIGGTSLFGGRGTIKSALLGALVITSIDNGLGLLGLGSGEKFVITGGVLLLAVTVDSVWRAGAQTRAERADGQGRVRHGRQPRRGRCGGPHSSAAGGWRVAFASRSGDDLGSTVRWGSPATCATRRRSRPRWPPRWSASGASTSWSRTPAWAPTGRSWSSTRTTSRTMIDVNLKGTLYTARATLPHLIEASGDFVSLASVAGLRALPGETVYNASKFGQVGFTRSLDHELREQGVRVTNLCPGGIATDFAMGTGRTQDMPELEGMMSAEEVADVAWFVVSRPKGLRMMTVSFRPMNEGSWG